jgi:type II secretory pathway pseudopilin PulG/D-ribose pyranose/furanose isomerase RbsD
MTINHRQSSHTFQKGFMILEALVVITVLMSLMSLGVRSITKNAEKTVNQVTAKQLQQITQAAQHYVQDHYPSFKNNSNPILTWKQLVDGGYLSPLFSNKNHYGQGYTFTVMKEQQGTVQLLLTTEGGLTINEQSLRQIAARAGRSAGYASVLDPGNIVGTQRSWVLEGTTLTPGHLASLTLVNEQEVMDAGTFLRRTQITGHPEYNQMETDLWMMDNTIQMKKNSRVATLNQDALIFNQGESKSISMFNSQYPNITIQDDTLPIPNTMTINSADLKFKKGVNGIYLGVDAPKMVIENKSLNWSTEIKPAEIILESEQSKNKSYVGNDKIVLSNTNNDSTTLNANNLSLNNQIMVDKNFIKIPFYGVNSLDITKNIEDVAVKKVGCGNVNSIGRLFVVGDNRNYTKYICICIDKPSTNYHSYIIINKNEVEPDYHWNNYN